MKAELKDIDRRAALLAVVVVIGTLITINGINLILVNTGVLAGGEAAVSLISALLTLALGMGILAFGSVKLYRHWRQQHQQHLEEQDDTYVDLTEEEES